MITVNGKKLLSQRVGDNMATSTLRVLNTTTSMKCLIPITDINGSIRYTNGSQYTSSGNASIITTQLRSVTGSSSNYAQNGFAIGSGSTPPTENDYTLENQIYGTITASSVTNTFTVEDDNTKSVLTRNWTITNNTGAEIVIREMGIFRNTNSVATRGGEISSYSSSNAQACACVMTDRIVLGEPVTIPNGEARIVSYKFVSVWTEEEQEE